ncbi:hypothetical protein SANTM175S_00578 [Streptomyces antimycoticus]
MADAREARETREASVTEESAAGTTAAKPEPAARTGLGQGPGRLLVLLYGVFTVAAASRSIYQLIAQYQEAPLAYILSAVSAVVYAFITVSLVRGGEGARKAAMVCCAAELVGVLTVGTWTLADPSAFPTRRCGPTTGWVICSSRSSCRSRACCGCARPAGAHRMRRLGPDRRRGPAQAPPLIPALGRRPGRQSSPADDRRPQATA